MIMRTICQVGLVFPGHILLRTPNPVQQHQYPVVDISSLNVRHLNWELQSRLRKHDHSLVDLCLSIPIKDVASFVSLPDEDGSILPEDVAHPILLQQYNYSWTINSTSKQKQISNWIRNLSLDDRKRRYGNNRTITFINLEGFLLSRPEVYRKNDKIHDKSFYWGHEWDLLSTIEEEYS